MKKLIVFILIIGLIITFSFYWIALKPAITRKGCLKVVQAQYGTDLQSRGLDQVRKGNNLFRKCLIDHGETPIMLFAEPEKEAETNDTIIDDTNNIEDSLDDLRETIIQDNANREYEEQHRGWCEAGGGIYYGNGTCITDNN